MCFSYKSWFPLKLVFLVRLFPFDVADELFMCPPTPVPNRPYGFCRRKAPCLLTLLAWPQLAKLTEKTRCISGE